jgi:hypothetical protein
MTLLVAMSGLIAAAPASGQLRIVDYNTTGGPRLGLDIVLAAIGSEIVNGIARPPDVLALQEQAFSATTTQSIIDVLNGLYGAGLYARATLDGATSGAGRPGMIYNTQTVEFVPLTGQVAFGAVGTSAQARQTLRYQLRPMGYDESADFYIYSNHYKAGTTSSDLSRRNLEAIELRDDLDALGDGVHAILAGDYNIRSSSEASYQTLLAPGEGQAFDPLNQPGVWHNSELLKGTHTQAPASVAGGGLVGGGMDDRFDFQLVTGEFLDGEGLDFIPGSYRALGNNGMHECCDADITTGSGASPAVLSALMTASDHLPVIVDYQIPAVLAAAVATVPETLSVGQSFSLAVTIHNAANVLNVIGADELDYVGMTSGDLTGAFSGVEYALGAGNTHFITLDTSAPGLKSGIITVSSDSQGVANGLVELPVSYLVAAVPEPAGSLLIGFGLVLSGGRRRPRRCEKQQTGKAGRKHIAPRIELRKEQ